MLALPPKPPASVLLVQSRGCVRVIVRGGRGWVSMVGCVSTPSQATSIGTVRSVMSCIRIKKRACKIRGRVLESGRGCGSDV